MASLKDPLYFCSECKEIVKNLDELLFIDETSLKGFCCEECIEDFYFPLIKHYEGVEHSLRSKLNLLQEFAEDDIVDPGTVENTVDHPDEVFRLSNELGDIFYNFIKHFSGFSVTVVASVYRQEASFVFLALKTKSQALLTEFRYGVSVTENWSVDESDAPEDRPLNIPKKEMRQDDLGDEMEDEDMVFIQLLESKKSKILADVLMKSKGNDIPFEDYSGYESCFEETLESPDEVFEKKDNEGDMIFTYIKAFSKGTRREDSFFYIVTCLKRDTDRENVNVYPILALPTIDMEMCQEFRTGTRLSGPLKN